MRRRSNLDFERRRRSRRSSYRRRQAKKKLLGKLPKEKKKIHLNLEKIVSGWKVIVGQTTAAFKQALLQSIPKYNGETGEPILYVEFQTPLGRLYPDDSEAKQELQAIIEKQLGKSIELHMLVAEDHQQTNLTQITVDQAIRQNIHMDVQIEEL